ncbi:MAG: ATP-binding cassette domain-containing protein [bacterium]
MEPISPELLRLEGISHSYGGPTAAAVLSATGLSLARGESLVLLGPSGCGKSTLLMIAAGLLKPSAGSVSFDGSPHLAPDPRIALVQQAYGLFPWKSVRANVLLGLQLRGKQLGESELSRMLAELGIEGKLESYPGQLSGGQQQRVALARALLLKPELMLLDEPFGALDSLTRERLQELLLQLWRREGFAMLTVTHSLQEAAMLGERILVMDGTPGRIVAEIDNHGAREPGYRDGAEYMQTLARLRQAIGAAA